MTSAKYDIDKLLKNTKIDNRFRTILLLYRDMPHYPNLAYHDVKHVSSVINLFEIFRKLSGKGFDKLNLKAAYLAAAFHDIDHTGFPDSRTNDVDGTNIGRAIAVFTSWAVANLKLPECDETALIAKTILLISSTECPNNGPCIKDPELLELSAMLRDADMLWGTMPGNAEQCMIGMWAERNNTGLESGSPNIFHLLTQQIKSIQSYQPLSTPGRTYKNFIFKEAAERWAEVALEYQRQIEAAALVEQMSDEGVLKLAASLRQPLRELAESAKK